MLFGLLLGNFFHGGEGSKRIKLCKSIGLTKLSITPFFKMSIGLRIIHSINEQRQTHHYPTGNCHRILTKIPAGRGNKTGSVFRASTGNPISAHNLISDFQVVPGEAGLLSMRLHDLRHTSQLYLRLLESLPKTCKNSLVIVELRRILVPPS